METRCEDTDSFSGGYYSTLIMNESSCCCVCILACWGIGEAGFDPSRVSELEVDTWLEVGELCGVIRPSLGMWDDPVLMTVESRAERVDVLRRPLGDCEGDKLEEW